MLAACALNAFLALTAAPQEPTPARSVIDRISSAASAILGDRENGPFYIKFGGITRGAGFSVGPGVRFKGIAGGRLEAVGSVSVSHRKYLLAEGSLIAPLRGPRGLQAGLAARRLYFPQQDFFGIGASSARRDRVSYTYDENAGGAFVSLKPRRPDGSQGVLSLDARLEYRHPDVGRGHDPSLPSIEQRFEPANTPGLAAQPDFLVASFSADVSLAVPEGRPVNGGRYMASFSRFADRGPLPYTFNLIETDLRQYIPLASDDHIIVLRASGGFTMTSGGNEVPFYYLPTLGGGSSLRGFRDFRFHDRHSLLLQGEYRWFFSRLVDAAVFYDAGAVARRFSDLDENTLTNYGFGVRVGSETRVFARVDLALGGREGMRVFFKFSNVF